MKTTVWNQYAYFHISGWTPYHAPSHYSTRNSAKKGLHCKRPLAFNIKRTPRTGSCPLFPWPSWLQNNRPWISISNWGQHSDLLALLSEKRMWLANGCSMGVGDHYTRPEVAWAAYHAVVLSVDVKCTVRDFSELSSVNSETELQYNYISKAAEIYHNRNNCKHVSKVTFMITIEINNTLYKTYGGCWCSISY